MANLHEQARIEKRLPKIMKKVSASELGASEYDQGAHPIREKSIIDWRNFNTDMYSTDRSFTEIAEIAVENLGKQIDLRPYMIEHPHVCFTTDTL